MTDHERGAEMNDEDFDENILRRLEYLLDQEDEARRVFKDKILAIAPNYPEPRLEQEYNAYERLRHHWSDSQIREWIESFTTGENGVPDDVGEGGRPDGETFLGLIGLIAEGECARALPQHDMLMRVAGQEAAQGHRQSRGLRNTRASRMEKTEQNAIRWQKMADTLVSTNPHLKSKLEVAAHIEKVTGVSRHTIRKHIKV